MSSSSIRRKSSVSPVAAKQNNVIPGMAFLRAKLFIKQAFVRFNFYCSLAPLRVILHVFSRRRVLGFILVSMIFTLFRLQSYALPLRPNDVAASLADFFAKNKPRVKITALRGIRGPRADAMIFTLFRLQPYASPSRPYDVAASLADFFAKNKPRVKITALRGIRGPRADASETRNGRRRAAVRAATKHAFSGYSAMAMGYDELQPVSGKGVNNFMPPAGFGGLTIFDSLDTLAITGLDQLLSVAGVWVERFGSTGFGHVGEVGVFESVIRILGGLLGAWEVTGREVFLRKAEQVGKVFVGCFLNPTKLPKTRVNVSSGVCSSYGFQGTVPAEVNLIMEWRAMARASGGAFEKALKNQRKIVNLLQHDASFGGLVPADLDSEPFEGRVIGRGYEASVGAPSDSYYEYLIKSHIVTEGAESEWAGYWLEVVDTILDVLVVDVPGFGKVPTSTEKRFVDKSQRKLLSSGTIEMDHFSCFLPGLLYLSVDMVPPPGRGPFSSKRRAEVIRTARGLTESCINLYNTTSGLSGERVRFQSNENYLFLGEYKLRPEVVEALFYESRLAPDYAVRARAQDEAWKIFQAIEKHAKTPFGYSSIRNPNGDLEKLEKSNSMPSYFTAETLKYLYLTFQDSNDKSTHVMDLDEWVFSTEAHPIRIGRSLKDPAR